MHARTLMRLLVLGVLAPAAAILASADAQTLLLTLDTPNPQQHVNFALSLAVGDVNGDGKGDIAVGAPYEDLGDNADQGRAYVFSGPVPVGGIAEFAQPEPDAASASGGSSLPPYGALAGVAAGVVVLAAGGWYARRRRRAR